MGFVSLTQEECYPALLVEELPGGLVQCHTCLRRCVVAPGGRGWCGTRENRDGVLYSLIYGRVASLSLNPIEKKPVFHFLPGSRWLSVGSLGCNFRCPGCQNWELAHAEVGASLRSCRYLSPDELVRLAMRHGAAGISFTFNEPALWLEYILDTAPLARGQGLFTNIVTNGALTKEALEALGPHLDVYRVDIKGYRPETYKRLAQMEEVAAIREVAGQARRRWGMWVEVVTNIIPGFNDDRETIEGIAAWLVRDLGPDTPWHATRFHPAYRLQDVPSTPVKMLEEAYRSARKAGVRFPYVGNVPGHPGENTYCPGCRREVIRRYIFSISDCRLRGGVCEYCGMPLPGVWV